MTTINYMQGRKKYGRPQAMLWSDSPGTLAVDPETEESFYVPVGYEVGAITPDGASQELVDNFIILSDDNRTPINFSNQRIERRERTVNGRMRSYHIADKISISSGWNLLPSRSHSGLANFDENGATSLRSSGARSPGDDASFEILPNETLFNQSYTTDGGAGGMEILDWYESHQGSFWIFLAYDKYKNLGTGNSAFQQLNKYSQVVEVFFSDFSYSVEKRGGSNYDFWNINFTLEEV